MPRRRQSSPTRTTMCSSLCPASRLSPATSIWTSTSNFAISRHLDYQPSWLPVFRGLGINIVYLGDFHDDSDPRDPGPKRLMEQKVYFEGAQRVSDKNFLVIPAEEVNSFLGGHWYLMMPKPVYFTHSGPQTCGSAV